MLAAEALNRLVIAGRRIEKATPDIRGAPELGALRELPGTWSNTEGFEGHGWNLIALPFGPPGAFGDFRLLLNQTNESLDFNLVDLGVPNRGANRRDQHLAALRYMQTINQVAATDAASDPSGNVTVPATPDTNDTPKGAHLQNAPGVPPDSPVGIHREPGLFMHLSNFAGPASNQTQPGPDLGRLANIPHGDCVLAMGFNGNAEPMFGQPGLGDPTLKTAFSPLPIGLATNDLANPYFGPYQHFHANPFQALFDPTEPLALLQGAIEAAIPHSEIIETTTLSFDTEVSGAILNIPFITIQANSTRLNSTFWIQKVRINDNTRFVMQYAQRVLLEFFPRSDGSPGLIQWPHISINTLIRQLP